MIQYSTLAGLLPHRHHPVADALAAALGGGSGDAG